MPFNEIQYRAIDLRPLRLHQIEYEFRRPVATLMHNANCRIIALGNGLNPNFAFERRMSVIQYRIDRSFGRLNSIWWRSAVDGGSNQARSRAFSSRRCPVSSCGGAGSQRTRLIGSAGTLPSPPLLCDTARGYPDARSAPSFGRRRIRADIAQDCPGGAKMRQAALAVQDPRISNFNAAEHRPDLAPAIILDPSEALTVGTEPAR